MCPASASVETSYSGWTETAAGTGTYAEATGLTLPNVGTVYDTWMITFTSSTDFTVVGTNSGTLASGSTASSYNATNPNGGYYFQLDSSGWSGSWASGDTIAFTTSPASFPIWMKNVVPTGSASTSLNAPIIVVTGESS